MSSRRRRSTNVRPEEPSSGGTSTVLRGSRSTPPEGCGGPWAFLERRQHYSPLRLFELLAELLEADPDQRVREVLGDRYEELEELCRWLRLDHFDRRAANRRLAEGTIDRARSRA
jgi:hypothetical protein